MADRFTYRDGKPVEGKPGHHGSQFQVGDLVLSPLDSGKNEAVFDVKQAGQEGSLVCSRQNADSSLFNTLHRLAVVEVISNGFFHYYTPDDYMKHAPKWRDRLLVEARQLSQSLQGSQMIATEYLQRDGSFAAWVTKGFATVLRKVEHKKDVTPDDYDPLKTRVWAQWDKLKQATACDYQVLHDAGLEFMHVRHEQAAIEKRVLNQIGDLIGIAEKEGNALKEVEQASFWMLDLYGQMMCKDPMSRFAYRFGVLVVRAGARGLGEYASDGSQREVLKAAGDSVREDLPKAATGLIREAIKVGESKNLVDTIAQEVIGLALFHLFFTVDYILFEEPKLAPNKDPQEAYVNALAEPFAEQIVTSIGNIIVATMVKNLPEDHPARKQIERIGAVIPTLINSCLREVTQMRSRAKDEGHQFLDVFASEGGGAAARIIRDVAKAWAEGSIKAWMKGRNEQDKAYYRGLILSLYMRVAPVNAARASKPVPNIRPIDEEHAGGPRILRTTVYKPPVNWKSQLAVVKQGPDEHGNIGLDKYQQAAGEAAPPTATSAAKPDRAARKQVKILGAASAQKGEERFRNLPTAYKESDIQRMTKEGKITADTRKLKVILRVDGKEIDKWWELSTRAGKHWYPYGELDRMAYARTESMRIKGKAELVLVHYDFGPATKGTGPEKIMLSHGTDTPGFHSLGGLGAGRIDVLYSSVRHDSHLHQDLGQGFYMAEGSSGLGVAEGAAELRARGSKATGGTRQILVWEVDRAAVGNVVDVAPGGEHEKLWNDFLDRPLDQSHPEYGTIRKQVQQGNQRGRYFEEFLTSIGKQDADAVRGPTGTPETSMTESVAVQWSIRSSRAAAYLNSIMSGPPNSSHQ